MLRKFFFSRQMSGRDSKEHHRVATPLELLFDLVYVVAIAAAASGLHHAFAHHHIVSGLLSYGLAFFYIWWAWMNFTWFASAFDTDDVGFRIAAMLQMFDSLVLAAQIPSLFSLEADLKLALLGYSIMRFALVWQWFRAAIQAPQYRSTCLAYAFGIIIMQICWYSTLIVPKDLLLPVQLILILGELAVPFVAERMGNTPWHPHHMAERYGLLVIIVLGEGVLGSLNLLLALANENLWLACAYGFATLLIVFMLWWVYFDATHKSPLFAIDKSLKTNTIFAYTHYFLFAALAGVGSGLELVVDSIAKDSHISGVFALTILGAIVAFSLFCIMVVMWIAGVFGRMWWVAVLAVIISFLGSLVTALGGSVVLGLFVIALAPIFMVLAIRLD